MHKRIGNFPAADSSVYQDLLFGVEGLVFGVVAELLAFAEDGDAFFHPQGHRGAFQVVVEEFLQSVGDVFAVFARADVVFLAVVLQHPYGFVEAAEGHEVFYPLIPGHCAVVVVVHYQQRGVDAVGVEDGGVGDIEFRRFPEISTYAALSHFVLCLA